MSPVCDLFLDVGETMTVGRHHLCNAVGDDEFRTRERKPRLFVGDRERGVLDELGERLGRQLERRRLERRYLGKLFAGGAGELKSSIAALHRDPLVMLLF